ISSAITYYVVAYISRHKRDLLSFPTRRSSDLQRRPGALPLCPAARRRQKICRDGLGPALAVWLRPDLHNLRLPGSAPERRYHPRSEEHTSELQSRFDLVCRLLLEKKKR